MGCAAAFLDEPELALRRVVRHAAVRAHPGDVKKEDRLHCAPESARDARTTKGPCACPYISRYLCINGRFCESACLLFWGKSGVSLIRASSELARLLQLLRLPRRSSERIERFHASKQRVLDLLLG